MPCQKPQADDRALLNSATAYVFNLFFYDMLFVKVI